MVIKVSLQVASLNGDLVCPSWRLGGGYSVCVWAVVGGTDRFASRLVPQCWD